MDKVGRELLVICVAGRFDMPPAGRPHTEPLGICDHQSPPPLEDVYWEQPGSSSLRHEGQNAYWRSGTDIYVSGQAWAPGGKPVKEMLVAIRIGPCRKGLQVFGDRVWNRGVLGLKPSPPLPFESMPLRWERSFGGSARPEYSASPVYEPRNPIGCGLYCSTKEAADRPLPNFEDPFHLLDSPTARTAPMGLGPIARSWQPRLGFAGTYDNAWKQRRAPLWPLDFDERFFQAAAPDLHVAKGLAGSEKVVLSGLAPGGQHAFSLPHRRLMVKSVFRRRTERRQMVLDAVHLEPEENAVTLFWRTAVLADRELAEHEYSVVRELQPWEEVS